jgi:hypothetical protein
MRAGISGSINFQIPTFGPSPWYSPEKIQYPLILLIVPLKSNTSQSLCDAKLKGSIFMNRIITGSNSYRMTITNDGTDTGSVVGSMSATVDTGNNSVNINAVLSQNTALPADSVIQQQFTDFIAEVRAQSNSIGLTQFGPTVTA